jgi:hypothetical protein
MPITVHRLLYRYSVPFRDGGEVGTWSRGSTMPDREPAASLLAQARALREDRDRWATYAPEILRALRETDVSLREIERETGISRSTAARLSLTTGSGPSPAAS